MEHKRLMWLSVHFLLINGNFLFFPGLGRYHHGVMCWGKLGLCYGEIELTSSEVSKVTDSSLHYCLKEVKMICRRNQRADPYSWKNWCHHPSFMSTVVLQLMHICLHERFDGWCVELWLEYWSRLGEFWKSSSWHLPLDPELQALIIFEVSCTEVSKFKH